MDAIDGCIMIVGNAGWRGINAVIYEQHPLELSLSKPTRSFDPSPSSGQARLRANAGVSLAARSDQTVSSVSMPKGTGW